jgi:hypothetical protein
MMTLLWTQGVLGFGAGAETAVQAVLGHRPGSYQRLGTGDDDLAVDTGRDRTSRWSIDRNRALYSARGIFLGGDMAVAYFMGHAPKNFCSTAVMLLSSIVLSFFCVAGPGRWAFENRAPN